MHGAPNLQILAATRSNVADPSGRWLCGSYYEGTASGINGPYALQQAIVASTTPSWSGPWTAGDVVLIYQTDSALKGAVRGQTICSCNREGYSLPGDVPCDGKGKLKAWCRSPDQICHFLSKLPLRRELSSVSLLLLLLLLRPKTDEEDGDEDPKGDDFPPQRLSASIFLLKNPKHYDWKTRKHNYSHACRVPLRRTDRNGLRWCPSVPTIT